MLFYCWLTKPITSEMLGEKKETVLFALKEMAVLRRYRQ